MKPIALQLYTVREEAAADLTGVLRQVSEAGYQGVETAGLYGLKPAEAARLFQDMGLTVCSSHLSFPDPENIGDIVATAQALGITRVVSGLGPDNFKTVEDCKASAARAAAGAERLAAHGLTFGYHNHWWELGRLDDRLVYDILMEEAPRIFGELDVYWAAWAKADPIEVIGRYRKRLPLLHIKDGKMESRMPMTAVGDGILPIPQIIKAADPDTLEWLIVEMDACEGDVMEAVRQSYTYLAGIQEA